MICTPGSLRELSQAPLAFLESPRALLSSFGHSQALRLITTSWPPRALLAGLPGLPEPLPRLCFMDFVYAAIILAMGVCGRGAPICSHPVNSVIVQKYCFTITKETTLSWALPCSFCQAPLGSTWLPGLSWSIDELFLQPENTPWNCLRTVWGFPLTTPAAILRCLTDPTMGSCWGCLYVYMYIQSYFHP